MNLQKQIDDLFQSQQKDWKILADSVNGLSQTKLKTFQWEEVGTAQVQYNPARMLSSSAKVDAKSIAERPCFLCEANRPAQQRGIPFLDKYVILCNPYPILPKHITIPIHSHVPQRIRKKIGDMLTLAEELPDYIVFYNGPKCGASAPDHFHLQAGLKSPILLEGDNNLRTCLVIESDSKSEAEELFEDVYKFLHSRQKSEEEPMLNIIAYVESGMYKLHIFPRKQHRPTQFFLEGDEQLLISPGALDMAGLIITVREEDFEKIKKEDLEDIYKQVSLIIN